MHTTNYYNTLIEIAEDCPESEGKVPPLRGDKKSVANYQFDMIYDQPYKYTSDEILFSVFAIRKGFKKSERKEQKEIYFSKGQPCFRASPLTKRYGWGIHSNAEGKVAIFAVDSNEYKALIENQSVRKVKAMRSKRK